jgi:type IV secretory pathway VirJ component
MRNRALKWWMLAGLLAATATAAEVTEEILDDPSFGQLTVYQASEEPKGVALFASGAGGWSADLVAAARALAQLDYVVAGINLDDYLTRLNRTDTACLDLSADFDRLNRILEDRYPIATHQPPILLGFGAGAALTYTALVQAPNDRFHTGISVDFCPHLPLRKPLCPGNGHLATTPSPDNQGVNLNPSTEIPTTWFVFQNRPGCDATTTTQWLKSIPLVRLVELSGVEGSKSWLPQVSALMQWLDPSIIKQVQPDANLVGVPLTEVPATEKPERPQLAVMLSGDGGWALLDRAVTAELAKNGLPTLGWDSLSYFWKARQPAEVALDLEQVLRQYLERWQKERIVLVGYSFGADVLPAVINRLPPALRERIDLVVFLGLSPYASFEFKLSNWISDAPDQGDQPIQPQIEKMAGLKRLCIYGLEEDDALCPKLGTLGVIINPMPGDHHFDEDYPGVAKRILDQLPPAQTAPSATSPTLQTPVPALPPPLAQPPQPAAAH